ncbi:MAG: cell division protein FtsB [Gammaproteobacteria bacterium]|jgi:cell division protein FtsB
MRPLIAILLVLVVLVQYRIWVGKDSLVDVWQLEQAVAAQREENHQLRMRNQQLLAEVRDLKNGLAAVEARAREELGMVRKDETLYRFTDR